MNIRQLRDKKAGPKYAMEESESIDDDALMAAFSDEDASEEPKKNGVADLGIVQPENSLQSDVQMTTSTKATQKTKAAEAPKEELIKLSDFCFALHNFPANLKTDYLSRANKLGFKSQVSVPTKINKVAEANNIIVISYNGQDYQLPATKSTHLKFIVNHLWLKQTSDAIENSIVPSYEVSQLKACLESYTFTFAEENTELFCFDPDQIANDGKNTNLQDKITKNLGTLVSTLKAGTRVIVRLNEQPPSSNQVMAAVSAFIQTFKVTETLFNNISVLSERWLDLCIESGELVDEAEFNLGNVFKVCTQNDRSLFHSVPEPKGQKKKGSQSLQEQQKGKTAQEIIESVNEQMQDINFNEGIEMMELMSDVVFWAYDNELEQEVEQLACFTGATALEQLVPFLTTHVVCKKETPQLRSLLNALIARNQSGAQNARKALSTDQTQVRLITIDWITESFIAKKKLSEKLFKPQAVQNNDSVSESTLNKQKKSFQYQVKLNLFQSQTFAINFDSFALNDTDKYDTEIMRKLIIENGGIIVDTEKPANFSIIADGHKPDIFQLGGVDELNRNIVHFRWVEQCITDKAIFSHTAALHLNPMPVKVPVADFQKVSIAFTLIPSEVDKLVFSTMAFDLYGFKSTFKDGQTSFLVAVDTTQMNQSQKIKNIKNWRKKPHVVSIDWLIDSMEQGNVISDFKDPAAAEKYLIKY